MIRACASWWRKKNTHHLVFHWKYCEMSLRKKSRPSKKGEWVMPWMTLLRGSMSLGPDMAKWDVWASKKPRFLVVRIEIRRNCIKCLRFWSSWRWNHIKFLYSRYLWKGKKSTWEGAGDIWTREGYYGFPKQNVTTTGILPNVSKAPHLIFH